VEHYLSTKRKSLINQKDLVRDQFILNIQPMNYKETLEYLYSQLPMYNRIGAAAYKADLTNTLLFCKILGDPQNSFPSIHIAGTNGKGSVSHMLASILQESGFKVGLYTSPHLKDFRERIRINGKMIPRIAVTHFVSEHIQDVERIRPSFFEMTVGMAFDHFRKEKIDIAVVEVGLGGRLDSTNIITPLLSIITNISFDHKQFLGDSLEAIAAEKAGIIKEGIPVVVGETQPETKRVFDRVAATNKARIIYADALFSGRIIPPSKAESTSLHMDIFRKKKIFRKNLSTPLSGHYQLKNIITVLAACEELQKGAFTPHPDSVIDGIRNVVVNTGLQGRWQILSYDPLTICDTGHNQGGINEVLLQLQKTPHKRLHIVFGMVNDKDVGEILQLLPKEAHYYFCKADIPRGLDAVLLHDKALETGLRGKVYTSVKKAVSAAKRAADIDDLVFIGGSTFVVAEAL
jgi:dihydrofolate synthase / folylpolyglutamate synthase